MDGGAARGGGTGAGDRQRTRGWRRAGPGTRGAAGGAAKGSGALSAEGGGGIGRRKRRHRLLGLRGGSNG